MPGDIRHWLVIYRLVPVSYSGSSSLDSRVSISYRYPGAKRSTEARQVIKILNHWNMDEEYYGEGEAQGGIESSVCHALNSTFICDEDVIDTLFVNCGGSASGKLHISTVIHYMKTTTNSEDDFEELRLMFGHGFDDALIDLDDYREVMLKYIETTRDRKAILPFAEVNDEDAAVKQVNSFPPVNKRISAISGRSSPGILDLSNMANCTFGSLEGTGGDISELPDSLQLLVENDDLRMQVKCLQEKQCKQDKFVAQLEEQAALQQTEAETRDRLLSSLREKYDLLQELSEEWQTHFERSEEENKRYADYVKTLEERVKQYETDLELTTAESQSSKKSQREMRRNLKMQETLRGGAEAKILLLEDMIAEQVTSAAKLEECIDSLKEEIVSLRCGKNDLQDCLAEAKDELLSLQGRMTAVTISRIGQSIDYDTDDQSPRNNLARRRVSFGHVNFMPSTPLPILGASLSINKEIRQAVSANECHLPSPFCEKPHISNWEDYVDESAEDSSFAVTERDEKSTGNSANDWDSEQLTTLSQILTELTEAEKLARQICNSLDSKSNSLSATESGDTTYMAQNSVNVTKNSGTFVIYGQKHDQVVENMRETVRTITGHLTRSQAILVQRAENRFAERSAGKSLCLSRTGALARKMAWVFKVALVCLVVITLCANRLMSVPSSAASSVWDVVSDQLFRPHLTSRRYSPPPV